ncbi:MAG: ComF family protein [Candidatus Omnitrophota bacterium]|nr:ComF family protein [Candidatus Omnitrophota bacterium]
MIRRLIEGLVDLVYPRRCHACKDKLTEASVEKLICSRCWSGIRKNTPPFCHSCGRRLDKGAFAKNICPQCQKTRLHFDRAFAPCVYEGVIRELIHEFKYNGKDYLGRPLSRLMSDFIKEYELPMNEIDYIIPVPLHKARLREREFNQAEILSEFIAGEFKKELLRDVLLRHRHTRTQTELKINQRLYNVRESFSIAAQDKIKGKNLLLIDDVLTSGATSSEAAYSLKKNGGAGIVFVLTLAN